MKAKDKKGTRNKSRTPKKMKPGVTPMRFPPSVRPNAMGYRSQSRLTQPVRSVWSRATPRFLAEELALNVLKANSNQETVPKA